MLKKYRYVACRDLQEYDDWEIVKIIDGTNIDMAVIMYEDNQEENKNIIELQQELNELRETFCYEKDLRIKYEKIIKKALERLNKFPDIWTTDEKGDVLKILKGDTNE